TLDDVNCWLGGLIRKRWTQEGSGVSGRPQETRAMLVVRRTRRGESVSVVARSARGVSTDGGAMTRQPIVGDPVGGAGALTADIPDIAMLLLIAPSVIAAPSRHDITGDD